MTSFLRLLTESHPIMPPYQSPLFLYSMAYVVSGGPSPLCKCLEMPVKRSHHPSALLPTRLVIKHFLRDATTLLPSQLAETLRGFTSSPSSGNHHCTNSPCSLKAFRGPLSETEAMERYFPNVLEAVLLNCDEHAFPRFNWL